MKRENSKSHRITVRVPTDLWEKIEEICHKQDRSYTYIVLTALEQLTRKGETIPTVIRKVMEIR